MFGYGDWIAFKGRELNIISSLCVCVCALVTQFKDEFASVCKWNESVSL